MSDPNQNNIKRSSNHDLYDVDDHHDDIPDDDHNNHTENHTTINITTTTSTNRSNTSSRNDQTKHNTTTGKRPPIGNTGSSGTVRKTTTTTTPSQQQQLPMFTLPDGRIIDGKNTLQSFDNGMIVVPISSRAAVVTAQPPNMSDDVNRSMLLPTTTVFGRLPDGRIIDGKNTLQSFAAVTGSGTVQVPVVPISNHHHSARVIHDTTRTTKPPRLRLPDDRLFRSRSRRTESPEPSLATDAAVVTTSQQLSVLPSSTRGTVETTNRMNTTTSVHHHHQQQPQQQPCNIVNHEQNTTTVHQQQYRHNPIHDDISDGIHGIQTNRPSVVDSVASINAVVVPDIAYGYNTTGHRNNNHHNSHNHNNNSDGMTLHVEAVPVQSLVIVNAEIATNTQIDDQQQQRRYCSPGEKSRLTFWFSMIGAMILGGIVTGIIVHWL